MSFKRALLASPIHATRDLGRAGVFRDVVRGLLRGKAPERELQLGQPQLARLRGPAQTRFTPETKSALLELAYAASSDALLTPVTDALGWHDRMNTPGTVGTHNWTFRLPWTADELFSAPESVATASELAHLAERYGRKR